MPTEREHNGITLDSKALVTLAALVREDSLTTSDVRDVLNASNSVANNRIEKLDAGGLATVERPPKPENGPWPPKTVEPTAAGKQAVKEWGIGDATPGTATERLDIIERRLSRVEEQQRTIIRLLGGAGQKTPNIAQLRAGIFAMNSYLTKEMEAHLDGYMATAIEREMDDLEEELDDLRRD